MALCLALTAGWERALEAAAEAVRQVTPMLFGWHFARLVLLNWAL